jgi:hypothetical protein
LGGTDAADAPATRRADVPTLTMAKRVQDRVGRDDDARLERGERAVDRAEIGSRGREQRAVREHALQALRDRVRAAQVSGHAVAAQARQQGIDARGGAGVRLLAVRASGAVLVAPADARRIVCEAGGVGVAVRGLVDQHAIEQQLDANVGDGAARAAGTAEGGEALVELAHQAEHRGQAVECAVSRVVVRDAGGDVGVGRVGEACADHRREVGEHRAEHEAGRRRLPARDRGVPEEVHASW